MFYALLVKVEEFLFILGFVSIGTNKLAGTVHETHI